MVIRARRSKSAPVGVVSKVLRILEALNKSATGLRLREITELTGLNKSTAYRFLAHLEKEDYLFRDEGGVYIVGPKLARLGSGAAYHTTLRKVSRPVLLSISSVTKETVNLGVMDGNEVLYLDVMESPYTFRMVSQPGMRRHLNCTALGKAILAYLPEDEREHVFPMLIFEQLTPRTILGLPRLRKELRRISTLGYAMDDQEAVLGARCIAAPIFDGSGKVTAAISVSGPVTRIDRERFQSLAGTVGKGARTISKLLGQQN
jgi:DNA-binding IclR family transcriptional regulator